MSEKSILGNFQMEASELEALAPDQKELDCSFSINICNLVACVFDITFQEW